MKKPTNYHPINSNQIRTLKLIYKFRFITLEQLRLYKHEKSLTGVYRTIKSLEDQGYIDSKYSRSYKLLGKGARYYLSAKGIKYLKQEKGINHDVLHSMYKNKSVSETFIDHNLDVFSALLSLRSQYPDTFTFFTKYEIAGYDYFPKPAPDLYLKRSSPETNSTNHYLLDIFSDSQFFVIKKRFDIYLEHFETGDWESVNKSVYPTLLFVCPNARLEDRLNKHMERILDSAGIDDLFIYTSTTNTLLKSDSINTSIWSSVYEPEKLRSL